MVLNATAPNAGARDTQARQHESEHRGFWHGGRIGQRDRPVGGELEYEMYGLMSMPPIAVPNVPRIWLTPSECTFG